MPSQSWRPDDRVLSVPLFAGEPQTDMEATLVRWTNKLNEGFPDRLSHLVWDRTRVRLLEEALEGIARDDEECPEHLAAFYRRSLINRLTGMGPLDALLLDDTVSEIMVNGQTVYVERLGIIEPCAVEFYDVDEVQDLARRIANRAGRELNTEVPVCDARLSDGSRIHCVLPPVSEVPTITIRRAPIETLGVEQYLANGSISPELLEDLRDLVRARRNIIIAGGASSGKTSLLRLMASWIGDEERLVTIEDVRELNVEHQNTVRLEAYRQFVVKELIKNALRMRPDRIIVGEVRGDESLDLLEAMSSGHPGSLCTVHSADGGMGTIYRLARTALQKGSGISFDSLIQQIMDTIQIVIYLVREPGGRRRIDTVMNVTPDALSMRWHWNGGAFLQGETP